jgi:hypothetical protein
MSDRTLKADAARAGLTVAEYRRHLEHGELYCYRCQDFHSAAAFGPDNRRPCGKATSCLRSIHQARQAALRRKQGGRAAAQPGGGQPGAPQPGAPPATAQGQWVAVIREASPGPLAIDTAAYWTGPDGPGGNRTWTASPAVAARFPTVRELRDALIAAYGDPGNVPSGCRLARIGQ